MEIIAIKGPNVKEFDIENCRARDVRNAEALMLKKMDETATGHFLNHAALTVRNESRDGQIARGQMADKIDEIGQIARFHAVFVKGQDEPTLRRLDQIIAVLDALCNTLAGTRRADIIARQKAFQRLR